MRRQMVLGILLFTSASIFGQTPKTGNVFAGSIIGTGDVLQVKVFQTPDLDTQARVDDGGSVSLPLIGAVHVAGLTSVEAGKAISESYSKANYIKGLDVTVLVTENASSRVSVLGEVKSPGSIPLTPHMRLLDVISEAGGLDTNSAGIVSVSHRDGSAPQTYRVSGPLAGIQNPEIQSGDTIQAEKAGIVYVVGAVNHAGGFVLESGKTVSMLQAIALAEGATTTAKLKQALLIRTKDGNRTITHVNISALLRNQATDQIMEPDDILFIPNSQFKEVLRTGGQGAVEMAAAMSIYHI